MDQIRLDKIIEIDNKIIDSRKIKMSKIDEFNKTANNINKVISENEFMYNNIIDLKNNIQILTKKTLLEYLYSFIIISLILYLIF